MPDLEELIRRTLRERQAEAPVGADLLVGARSRRRKRRTGLAVIGVAVATAAAVITPLTVISHGRSTASEQLPSGQGTAPPSTIVTPTPDDQMFMVTAPLLGVASRGPAGIQQPTCTPDEIDATAQLKRSVYGVVGVVQLHGQHCSIPWYSRPTSFIDANGQPLDIPVVPGNQVGENIRPDIAEDAGEVAMGFAWTGSWCGSAPAGIVVPLLSNPATDPTGKPSVTAPITGPGLACTGASDSTLVLGAAGGIGEPVLPPPAAWSSLTATLTSAGPPPYIGHLDVTFTNDSDSDVVLDPCPQFALVLSYTNDRGDYQSGNRGLLPCDTGSTVPAHGKITIGLPSVKLGDGVIRDPGTLRFGVAGGVTASIDLPVK